MLDLPTIKTDFLFKNSQISIRLHMQDHNIPLSLLIISVYILTVLVLLNMFSKGHVTVTSCLFLQYNPSINPKKVGKVLSHSSECQFFALITFQNGSFRSRISRRFGKVFFVSISYVIWCSKFFKQL